MKCISQCRKKWEIYKADIDLATSIETLTLVDILSIAPETYDMGTLIIPKNKLEYGTYKLRFYSRMWDEDEADKLLTHVLPFERSNHTYIKIVPTPLVAQILEGSMDLVTRGEGQQFVADPSQFSRDPDYPNDPVCLHCY